MKNQNKMDKTINIKDMFLHRENRLSCKPLSIWEKKYKNKFLKNEKVVCVDHFKSNIVLDKWKEVYRQHILFESIIFCYRYNEDHVPKDSLKTIRENSLTVEIAVDAIMNWLNTSEGRNFISDAFEVKIEKENESNEEIILQKHEDLNIEETINFYKKNPEALEIAADTLIGWLNSPVGRSFICEVFENESPRYAKDKSY